MTAITLLLGVAFSGDLVATYTAAGRKGARGTFGAWAVYARRRAAGRLDVAALAEISVAFALLVVVAVGFEFLPSPA